VTGTTWHRAGDLPVAVTAPDPGHVAEYLSGYLASPAAGPALPPRHLTLHTGQEALRRAAAEFTAGPVTRIEPVPGVTLTEAALPGGGRGYTVAADHLEGAPGTWAASAAADGRVTLYTSSHAKGPRHVLRIIREIMMRAHEDAGAVVFHAAGVTVPAGTVMICGPRSAGKTTTAAAVLAAHGPRASLLSNDRLLVAGRRVIAVPLPVPVARGTLDAFPALAAAAGEAARARPGEPSPRDLPAGFGSPRKTAFPSRVFAAAFGAGLAPDGHLAAVIVPALSDTSDPVTTRRLSPGEAASVLARCCCTPADEFWRPWLAPRARPDADLAAAAAARCRDLAAAVPFTAVTYGVRGPAAAYQQADATGAAA
jgi:hypothetical protein